MYNSYNYNSPAPPSSDSPDEGPLIGLVQHLNKDELTDLLENETKVLEMVCDNVQIKQMVTQKQTVEASVKSLAEYNMNQKPTLENLKSTLKSLHNQLNEVRGFHDIARVKLDSVGNTLPEDILALLQASVAEVDEQSEVTASAFLNGNIDCDSFLAQFRRERKLAHQRRIRAEKMGELVSHQPAVSAPIAASVTPSVSMPLSGPPPLPPRDFAAHTTYAPQPPASVAPPLPSRPPAVGSYWNQPSMHMPQPYGAGAGGMYGAAGGGYNSYFNQRM